MELMDFLQIVVLAVVQGLTEFLPISSSGHLILVPLLTAWQDQGLAFDVAVHVGTLAAVVLYFRDDVGGMIVSWFTSLKTRQCDNHAKLAWAVIFGTIPAGLCGLAFKDFIEENLRSPLVIAVTTIVFGLLLGLADWKGSRKREVKELSWKDVFFIGCAQALALIPGTSRSGITMTAALMIGFTREAAARYSFLLSIPLIFLAGGFLTLDLVQSGEVVDWFALILGVILSALSAYVCIHYFIKLLDKMGMLPYVIYRLVLGIFLLVMFI